MEVYWRTVLGYENRYLVSKNGEIWSIKRQIILATCLRNGYPAISLYNGDKKTFSIHIIVAWAFILRTDPNKNIVNHINGIITDSRVENLEWTDAKGNAQHAIQTGLKVYSTKKVSQYRSDGFKIATFDSIKEAAEKTGCSSKHIPSVCRGKHKTHGGFIWKYENEEDMPVTFDGIGRQHPWFPNYYIKTDATVYSMVTNRYMKPKVHKSGYHSIGLSNNGIVTEIYLHVLVAQLYLAYEHDQR